MTKQSTKNSTNAMNELTLGKTVVYSDQYDPSLLQSVPRQLNRDPLGLSADELPFKGEDQWTGYELSWLDEKGKPHIAILKCTVPVTSPNLIESKSFKLYLNSFNQTRFDDIQTVEKRLTDDLSLCAQSNVKVEILLPQDFDKLNIRQLPGDCIDDLDVSFSDYDYNASILSAVDEHAEETLISHLLKSNCLITNQPDWGSVVIRYQGRKIDRASLLKYIVSFRNHNEFHEQCVERIFCDLSERCNPDKLTVYARYTRRGGLDINPFRSNFEQPYVNHRTTRQ